MVEGIEGSEVLDNVFERIKEGRQAERVVYSKRSHQPFTDQIYTREGTCSESHNVTRGIEGYIITFEGNKWLVGMGREGTIFDGKNLYAYPLPKPTRKQTLQEIADDISLQSPGTILLKESNLRGKILLPCFYRGDSHPRLSQTIMKALEKSILEDYRTELNDDGFEVIASGIEYHPCIVQTLTDAMMKMFTTQKKKKKQMCTAVRH